MRDLPFEWTESLNKPLREDYWAKEANKKKYAWCDWMMIFQGFEMDYL